MVNEDKLNRAVYVQMDLASIQKKALKLCVGLTDNLD